MVAAKPDRGQQEGVQRMRKPVKRFEIEEGSPEPVSRLSSKRPDKVAKSAHNSCLCTP
jgi:hypothetical protein